MKATELLMNEHKNILRTLHVLDAMASRVEGGELIPERDAADVVRILRVFLREHHQGKEETVLFPALLRDPAHKNHASLSRMVNEHDQERSLVLTLEESVRIRNGRDFADFARRLVRVLSTHMDKEDHILFPLADATLSPEEDAQVLRSLEARERTWRTTVLPDLLKRISEMEPVYLAGLAARA